jgi:hypothetical protein
MTTGDETPDPGPVVWGGAVFIQPAASMRKVSRMAIARVGYFIRGDYSGG